MKWCEKLDEVLRSWHRTPYAPGQCLKGVGVDCVKLAWAVTRECAGMPTRPAPDLIAPPDAALHDRRLAVRSCVAMAGLCPPNYVVRNGTLEAGDVLVTAYFKSKERWPGHTGIIAANGRTVMHAMPGSGVRLTGLTTWLPYVLRTYRTVDKEVTWS